MKKIDQRLLTLIILGLVLLSMVVLSASLTGLEMNPGKDIPLESFKPDVGQYGSGGNIMSGLVAFLRIVMLILWGLIPLYIIYLIISPEARKQFIKDVLRMLPIVLLLWFFLANRNGQRVFENLEMQFEQPQLEDAYPMPEVEPLTFNANPPDWIVTFTSVLIALAITGLVVGIVYFVWRERQRKLAELRPLNDVAREAQAAIDAIQAGGDLRDVIMRAYVEMGKVISENRNITRGQDMTPHEFEVFLQGRGLPPEAIHQITELFEAVRYGALMPGRKEESMAISSLNVIINACRRQTS